MSAPQVTPPAGGGGGGGISGSGTAGYVAKFTSGTAVGDSLVRDDGTSVSIDSSPSVGYKLTVNGDTTIVGRIDALTGSINTVTSRASTDLVLQRDTVEAARIIAGGNVGIGTTNPLEKLAVSAGSNDRIGLNVSGTVSTLTFGSVGATAAIRTIAYDRTSAAWTFNYGNNPGPLSTALTIDNSGVSTFGAAVRATGTAATAPAFTGSDTDTGMYFPANNQVRLSTNGSFALAVDASQRVGIGQATPTAPLHVLGTSITAASTTTASAGIHRIEGSASNAIFVGSFSDSPFGMCLQTNSASYPLVLQPAGGSVGIRVTSPATNTLDVSTAGWGIKLPATPGNANVNTLDCYEEGSYTATAAAFTVTGSSPTQPLVVVQYTRIGRLVTLTGKVTLNAGTTNWASTIGGANITLPTGTTFDQIDGQLGAGLLWSTAGTPAVYSGVIMHPTNRLIYFPTVTPATTLTHYFTLQYMTAT